jgi:hypothetical protein
MGMKKALGFKGLRDSGQQVLIETQVSREEGVDQTGNPSLISKRVGQSADK